MCTCVVNAMEMTSMILHINLSVLTGNFLTGKCTVYVTLTYKSELELLLYWQY